MCVTRVSIRNAVFAASLFAVALMTAPASASPDAESKDGTTPRSADAGRRSWPLVFSFLKRSLSLE